MIIVDRNELSNLAFLIHALAANPSLRTFQAAESNMEFGGSEPYRASIAVLRTLIEKIATQQNTSKAMLVERLTQEAQKLANDPKPFDQSVGQALVWAIASSHNSFAHGRR